MRNPWKLTSLAFIAMLVAAASRGAVVAPVSAEPQPLMRQALESLRSAASSLEHGGRDKGGREGVA